MRAYLAGPDGLEPPTTGFEDQASIQLMLRADKREPHRTARLVEGEAVLFGRATRTRT